MTKGKDASAAAGEDFRFDPMESREGKGIAARAWQRYADTVNRLAAPAVEPLSRRFASRYAVDLLGFWLAWHLHGGFEGMVELGMHPTTVFRRARRFRQVYGMHPDEYRFPGIKLDQAAYWAAVAKERKVKKR
jgi:hypothetical protein